MKRAVAYIHHKAFLELFKVPYGMEIVAIDYPVDGKIRLTIEGDKLPVKETSKSAKKYPRVKYTVLRHWHFAKIEPMKETKDEKQGSADISTGKVEG